MTNTELNHFDESQPGFLGNAKAMVLPYYESGLKQLESIFKEYLFPNVESIYNNGCQRMKMISEKRDNLYDFVSETIKQLTQMVQAVFSWFYIRVCNVFGFGLRFINDSISYFKKLFFGYLDMFNKKAYPIVEPYFEKFMISYFYGLVVDFWSASIKIICQVWQGKITLIDVYRLLIKQTQDTTSMLVYKFGSDSFFATGVKYLYIMQILQILKFEKKSKDSETTKSE